jgi:four helix bundle protein
MEFKGLIVYQKALQLYSELETKVLSMKTLDRGLKDQLKRASISIILNIAEGSSRFSSADRKKFLVISRGSAFECLAVLHIISLSTKQTFPELENTLEEISKILYKMISTLNDQLKVKAP